MASRKPPVLDQNEIEALIARSRYVPPEEKEPLTVTARSEARTDGASSGDVPP